MAMNTVTVLENSDGVSGLDQRLQGTNGAGHVVDGALATIVVTSGSDTYIAEALPGSAATAAVWRCQKIDSSGSVTWADGDSNFDNTPGAAGSSLSGLTYS